MKRIRLKIFCKDGIEREISLNQLSSQKEAYLGQTELKKK